MTTVKAERIPHWTVGDRLKKARDAAGLEQSELAAMTGISRGTVSNYEQFDGDAERLKRPYLAAWAMACDVPLEWLMYGEQASPRPGGGLTSDSPVGLSTRYRMDTNGYTYQTAA